MTPSGPFAGLTVVEIGQFIVVPFCAQLLADGGARVIKVEPLEGDAYRRNSDLGAGESRQFLIKNRGKESVAVALGTAGGDAVIRRLLERADVVVVNMSPAAVERRGLGYERVRSLNPSVIYGAVTAFGRNGPEASLPGMDVVVQARSGLLAALGAEREGVPYHSEVQAADYAASLLLLSGIATALFVRERTGQGQQVDVSLLGAAMTLQNNVLRHVYEHDEWRHEFTGQVLPRLRREGANLERIQSTRNAMRPDPPVHTAHYRVFRTADGWIALGAGSPALRTRLFELLGIDVAVEDTARIQGAIERVLTSKSSAEWIMLLRDRAIPVAEVRDVDELLFDPHAEAEGLLADFHHDSLGAYRGLGVPLRLSETAFEARLPSPRFAAHTRSVLAELGYDDREIEELVADRAVAVAGQKAPTPPATRASNGSGSMTESPTC